MSWAWKRPVAYRGDVPSQCIVRVSDGDGNPLADVDMTGTDGRLSVQWPCRLDIISLSGGIARDVPKS